MGEPPSTWLASFSSRKWKSWFAWWSTSAVRNPSLVGHVRPRKRVDVGLDAQRVGVHLAPVGLGLLPPARAKTASIAAITAAKSINARTLILAPSIEPVPLPAAARFAPIAQVAPRCSADWCKASRLIQLPEAPSRLGRDSAGGYSVGSAANDRAGD